MSEQKSIWILEKGREAFLKYLEIEVSDHTEEEYKTWSGLSDEDIEEMYWFAIEDAVLQNVDASEFSDTVSIPFPDRGLFNKITVPVKRIDAETVYYSDEHYQNFN